MTPSFRKPHFRKDLHVGIDGAPRAIPIGFWWTGAQVVMATVPKSAKGTTAESQAAAANSRAAAARTISEPERHYLITQAARLNKPHTTSKSGLPELTSRDTVDSTTATG
jgi:hypothetical protein